MFNNYKEYLKLLRFAYPFKGLLFLASLCMGVSTIFASVTLGMIVPLADRVFTDKKIVIPGDLPEFLDQFVRYLNTIPSQVLLKQMLIFMVILFFLKGVFLFLQNYLMNKIGQGVVRDVRNQLYIKFHELSLDFFARKRVGELISRITNDVSFITHALSYALTDLIYQSMQIIFFALLSFSLAIKISWILPFVAFVLFPAIIVPVFKIGKRIKGYSLEVQRKMADINSLLTETFQGAYIVKVFCREQYEISRFKKINDHYYKFMLKSIKRMIALSPLTEFIGSFGVVIIIGIVGREILAGRISFGIFGLFLAYLLSIISPLKKLTNVYAINQQALVASSRIHSVLDQEPTVKEAVPSLAVKEFQRSIEFRDVSFSYENENEVLHNISFQVNRGEVVALVGSSGAGKSTLVALLPRLYDPQKGGIYFDGIEIKKMSLKSLRSLLSVVSQQLILFNATVKENIAYGKAGASMEEIISAAKKAHAYEFIMNLPQGFSTVVGEQGARISGGERQRISIARAILKDAPILIFDEATSQLDAESEKLIKDVLYHLMEEKTVFVIAHRLSTVKKANTIIVLDKGKIIEQGSHQELIAKQTFYKKLYEMQFMM